MLKLNIKYTVEDKYLSKDICSINQNGSKSCAVNGELFVKEKSDEIPTLTFEFKLVNNFPVFKRVYR